MIYGMWLSAQGVETQTLRQDVIANNLANASTTAFKRSLAVFESHPTYDLEQGLTQSLPGNVNRQTGGVSVGEVVTDYSNGNVPSTGQKNDIALAGKGFFRVSDGKHTYLTRNGRLDTDAQGRIVTYDNRLPVLGTNNSPLQTEPDQGPIEISEDGFVTQAAGSVEIGQIALVEPANYKQLVPHGESLYAVEGRVVPADPETRILQEHLETSGVTPISEMVGMIESTRILESNLNMIKYQDEALDRLLTSLPRK